MRSRCWRGRTGSRTKALAQGARGLEAKFLKSSLKDHHGMDISLVLFRAA